jgi:hypothetical protein
MASIVTSDGVKQTWQMGVALTEHFLVDDEEVVLVDGEHAADDTNGCRARADLVLA